MRDGGASFQVGSRTIWTWGDTVLSAPGADGEQWRDNSVSWADDLDWREGLPEFTGPTDAAGAPLELFPETTEEAAYNAAHRGDSCEDPCGAREVLWPMGSVTEPSGDALLFYMKIHGEPGAWNFFPRGVGLARWVAGDPLPTRPPAVPSEGDATMLWTDSRDDYGAAALLEGGYLYAWASSNPEDGLDKPVRVARVRPAEAWRKDVWTYWDGRAWSANPREAATLFQGNSQMTIAWNQHAGRFVASHMDGLSRRLVLRTAPKPEGPWSREILAIETEPAAGEGFPYCGYAHPELWREDGRIIVLSYYRGTGDWDGETRVVEIELR